MVTWREELRWWVATTPLVTGDRSRVHIGAHGALLDTVLNVLGLEVPRFGQGTLAVAG